MRLFYCRHYSWNFGDELNAWLWDRVLPFSFDRVVEGWWFVGIGSILNWPMMHPKVVVCGSGLGYGEVSEQWAEHVRTHWRVYCVRGPLTAGQLGLDSRCAVTDPAILVSQYFSGERAGPGAGRVTVVPHWLTAHTWPVRTAIRELCAKHGYGFIDPSEPLLDVLASLRSARLVLAESLHGAIVADALRVPWVPFSITRNPHNSPFKWRDWCGSMEVPYEPVLIGSATALKDQLEACGQHPGYLSRDEVFGLRVDAMQQAISRFVKDWQAGCYDR